MELTVVIRKEGNWHTAGAVDVDTVSQGKTIEDAMKNIKEAVELYLEDEDAQIKSVWDESVVIGENSPADYTTS